MNYFIDVIIPIPLEKLFTYSITSAEASFLKPGMRVSVPFGKSKIYTGIVYSIHNNEPHVYEAKEIQQILDEFPIVNSFQLKLWKWIAKYYMCTLGDVMRAALPSAFILESETIITKNNDHIIEDKDLKDDEFLVYEALHHQSSLKIHDIIKILDKKNVLPVINRLIEKDAIHLEQEIYEKYKPKLVRYIKLHANFSSENNLQTLLDDLKNAPKQRRVIMTLFSISAQTKKPIKVAQLTKESEASSAIVKALIDKEILEEFHIQTDRILYSGDNIENSKSLNEYQTIALNEIQQLFKKQNVTLLHGVTSSGKTEVYVKLIEDAINQGKQVLYLLPEIALTTQLVVRLQNYFGEKVSVFHSKYSLHERVEVWNNVLQNSSKAQIVLGARFFCVFAF